MWVCTVRRDKNMPRAISEVESPLATRAAILTSVGVSPAQPEALTPTEVKIAALVARGDSTSESARGMCLSRRTVQTYISHILAKLGAKSRVEIVREALRQGVSA